jgi:AcrR family transcriptional regulator
MQEAIMPRHKVIDINSRRLIEEKLVAAVGPVLARTGFNRFDAGLVAKEAGVNRSNVFRFFGGLPGLVAAYGESSHFWPSVEELLQETRQHFKDLPPEQQIAAFFKSMLITLRRRPLTLDIMAWEALERNELSKRLEDVRVRISLEYFENLQGEIPENIDLSAIVALLAGAVHFLTIRSRNTRTFAGIDLESEAGWRRIEQAIELLMHGSLTGK